MQKQYTNNIEAQNIEHKMILCDQCEEIITDNGIPWGESVHWQTGDKSGKKLLDFCSEKCLNKFVIRE